MGLARAGSLRSLWWEAFSGLKAVRFRLGWRTLSWGALHIGLLSATLCPMSGPLNVWGWTRRRWWAIILAGRARSRLWQWKRRPAYRLLLLSGADVPPAFFGISFLLPFRSVSLKRIQTELPWAATFTGTAVLVAAPILLHYIRYPDLFFNQRIQMLFIFREFQGAPVLTLARSWQPMCGRFCRNSVFASWPAAVLPLSTL